MGQVFTDKVDVSKLKEGEIAKVTSFVRTFRGPVFFSEGSWGVNDEHFGIYFVGNRDGTFYGGVRKVELINVPCLPDPTEKMKTEHAKMLAILAELDRYPYYNDDLRMMVQVFLTNRKPQ